MGQKDPGSNGARHAPGSNEDVERCVGVVLLGLNGLAEIAAMSRGLGASRQLDEIMAAADRIDFALGALIRELHQGDCEI